VIIDAIKYFQGQMDHKQIRLVQHITERQNEGKEEEPSDNSQDTTTKGACRKLDHYWTESEGISLTLAFNHNNNLQCIRKAICIGCTLMTYQTYTPIIKYIIYVGLM
jgi:hypothetical protein